MSESFRRVMFFVILAIIILAGITYDAVKSPGPTKEEVQQVTQINTEDKSLAVNSLKELPIKGRAPKTGYSRDQFSNGWADAGLCNVRNFILNRDLFNVVTKSSTDCTVVSGMLNDPYTKSLIVFTSSKSADVQIDHVVALSNAWQTGAQQISAEQRFQFANDSLNLLAVDGPTNQKKGDADAATWLPPNKEYRCQYIARQVAVKKKYSLWVTHAESEAMHRVLATCPAQQLPTVN